MKKERLDVMFDLETFSTNTDKGLVLSCAWIPFHLDGSPVEDVEPGIVYFDKCSSMNYGRIVDYNTMAWWMRQPNYEEMLINLEKFKMDFALGWCKVYAELSVIANHYKLVVWSRGIDFDFPLIQSCFRDAGITSKLPWQYYNKCDVRTLVKMAELTGYKKIVRAEGWEKHDAFDDCLFQIKEVQTALAHLGYKK